MTMRWMNSPFPQIACTTARLNVRRIAEVVTVLHTLVEYESGFARCSHTANDQIDKQLDLVNRGIDSSAVGSWFLSSCSHCNILHLEMKVARGTFSPNFDAGDGRKCMDTRALLGM